MIAFKALILIRKKSKREINFDSFKVGKRIKGRAYYSLKDFLRLLSIRLIAKDL